MVSGKAARMYSENSPLKVEEISFPNPGFDEVLVGINASGICFSDIHQLKRELPIISPPLVPEHEGAGIVEGYGNSLFCEMHLNKVRSRGSQEK